MHGMTHGCNSNSNYVRMAHGPATPPGTRRAAAPRKEAAAAADAAAAAPWAGTDLIRNVICVISSGVSSGLISSD